MENIDRDKAEIVVIDQLVSQEHLLRKIDTAVDFNRLYEMAEPLYCEDNGGHDIDPVVLLELILIRMKMLWSNGFGASCNE